MKKSKLWLIAFAFAVVAAIGALVLTAQTTTPAKKDQKQAAKTSTDKKAATAKTAADKKKDAKPQSTNTTISIDKCYGGDAHANGSFTFKAEDADYDVIVLNPTAVFSDCTDVVYSLKKGDSKTCTAVSGSGNSKYIVVPPHGLNKCPAGSSHVRHHGKIFNTGDPNDITVP